MSSRQLSNPGKRHEVSDDIEAFIHVLSWMCLRFCLHVMSDNPEVLKGYILLHYEEHGVREGDEKQQRVGGYAKRKLMRKGDPAVDLVNANTPLGELFETLAVLCQRHYHAVEPIVTSTPVSSSHSTGDTLADPRLSKLRNLYNDNLPSEARVSRAAPVVQAHEALSYHAPVYQAFLDALLEPKDQWAKVVRTPDRFKQPAFKSSADTQCSSACSSQQSSGSKRSLEGDSVDTERPGPSKRARSTNTDLREIQEE